MHVSLRPASSHTLVADDRPVLSPLERWAQIVPCHDSVDRALEGATATTSATDNASDAMGGHILAASDSRIRTQAWMCARKLIWWAEAPFTFACHHTLGRCRGRYWVVFVGEWGALRYFRLQVVRVVVRVCSRQKSAPHVRTPTPRIAGVVDLACDPHAVVVDQGAPPSLPSSFISKPLWPSACTSAGCAIHPTQPFAFEHS